MAVSIVMMAAIESNTLAISQVVSDSISSSSIGDS